MTIKLMSLSLLNKYNIKDGLVMAPESILNKKSTLDIYALGIFLVHLLFGVDVQRTQSDLLSGLTETFELSPVTMDFLSLLLVRQEGKTPTWKDVVDHPYSRETEQSGIDVKVTSVFEPT